MRLLQQTSGLAFYYVYPETEHEQLTPVLAVAPVGQIQVGFVVAKLLTFRYKH